MSTQAVAKTDAKAPLVAGNNLAAIVPQDAEQAFRMAQMICSSGMAPAGMNQPQQVVAAIFHGMEVGLKPMAAVQSIAVVNGRPTVWGDAAIGLVQGSGLLEDIDESFTGTGDDLTAICEIKRKDKTKPIVRPFSVSDAKTAGLWGKKGPWSQYPKRMLQMRARSWALRDGFSDVLKGLQLREEVQDYQASERIQALETEAITLDEIDQQAAPVEDIIDAEVEEQEVDFDLPPDFDVVGWVNAMHNGMNGLGGDKQKLELFRETNAAMMAKVASVNSDAAIEISNKLNSLIKGDLPEDP